MLTREAISPGPVYVHHIRVYNPTSNNNESINYIVISIDLVSNVNSAFLLVCTSIDSISQLVTQKGGWGGGRGIKSRGCRQTTTNK